MQAKCDMLVNNMSEAFNNVIMDARSKPIISMQEDIRLYIMKRWSKNRSKVQKYEGDICPKIRARLSKESEQTKYWIPRYFRMWSYFRFKIFQFGPSLRLSSFQYGPSLGLKFFTLVLV